MCIPFDDMPERLLEVERPVVEGERAVRGHRTNCAIATSGLRLRRHGPAKLFHALRIENADIDMVSRWLPSERGPEGVLGG